MLREPSPYKLARRFVRRRSLLAVCEPSTFNIRNRPTLPKDVAFLSRSFSWYREANACGDGLLMSGWLGPTLTL
jgi:hypothetical protein